MTGGPFLSQVIGRSVILMLGVAVVGLIVSGSEFALSVLVSGTFDIATFYLIARLAWQILGQQPVAVALRQSVVVTLELIGVFSARLVLKAMILLAALLYPGILNFWGVLIGILMIEIMLLISAGGSMIRRKPLEL